MRNTYGSLFEGGAEPFLALPELLLCQLAVSDIVGDSAQDLSAFVGDSTHADLHIRQRAILAPVLPLADEVASLYHSVPNVAIYALLVVGYDIVERQLPYLFSRVA